MSVVEDDVSGDKALVAWTPASDGGSTVVNYVVEMKSAAATAATAWSCINTDFTVTNTEYSLDVSRMEANVDYTFRVAALNKAGKGPYSDLSDKFKYGIYTLLNFRF